MSKRKGYGRLRTGAAIALGTLTVAAGGIAHAHAAPAAPFPFNGTYTAVLTSYTVDPRTGARVPQPGPADIWVVSSSCALQACNAKVVKRGESFNMLFDGQQWTRIALPHIGICYGATVPATSAAYFLVPRADGSLEGAVTSTVDCNGAPVESAQSLTVTPS